MSISFSGLASGLDTSSWITSLTALKQAKVTSLQTQKQNIISAQETLYNIKSYFSAFRSNLEKITDSKFNISNLDIFAKKLAKSSKVSAATASATSSAQEGTYKVTVEKLATNTRVQSGCKTGTVTTVRQEATSASTLNDIGIGSGEITIIKQDMTGATINVNSNWTMNQFVQQLGANGIEASFDNATKLFSIKAGISDIIDTANTHIVDKLNLVAAGSGYRSEALSEPITHTEYRVATESTELNLLGVSQGTFNIYKEGEDSPYQITLENNDTIQDLLDVLDSEGIDASFSEGVFTLTNAYIDSSSDTTGLAAAFGLNVPYTVDSFGGSSDDICSAGSVNVLANENTTFGQLGLVNEESIRFFEHWWAGAGYSNDEIAAMTITVTVDSTTTLGDFVADLNSRGINASIDTEHSMLYIDMLARIEQGSALEDLFTYSKDSSLVSEQIDLSSMTSGTPVTYGTTYPEGTSPITAAIESTSSPILRYETVVRLSTTVTVGATVTSDILTQFGISTTGMSYTGDSFIATNGMNTKLGELGLSGTQYITMNVGGTTEVLSFGDDASLQDIYDAIETLSPGYLNVSAQSILHNGFLVNVEETSRSGSTAISALNTNSTYSSGTFTISTSEDLKRLAGMVNNGKFTGDASNTKFILTNDINMPNSIDWGSVASGGIGTSANNFAFEFDGNGHVISNLTMNGSAYSRYGLFGYVNGRNSTSYAYIHDLGVENASISGSPSEGAGGILAGQVGRANIYNCYTTGSIVGNSVGALVGQSGNNDSINTSLDNCYSDASVSNYTGATQMSPYNYHSTTAGLVAYAWKATDITNCYGCGDLLLQSSGNTTGSTGGSHEFTRHSVDSIEKVNMMFNKFMNTVTHIDTSTLISLSTLDDSVQYSSGTFKISTTEELQKLAYMVNNSRFEGDASDTKFVLANNIDLSTFRDTENFIPIGYDELDTGYIPSFHAAFDGNGYVISNVDIIGNASSSGCIGLFGFTEDAVISNLGVEYSRGIGTTVDFVGGLVGRGNHITITNSYVSGDIICSNGEFVGGLVGYADDQSTISDSYVDSRIEGKAVVGGIIGQLDGGTISNCAVAGESVVGDDDAEGFVAPIAGKCDGTVSNCIYSSEIINYSGSVDDTQGTKVNNIYNEMFSSRGYITGMSSSLRSVLGLKTNPMLNFAENTTSPVENSVTLRELGFVGNSIFRLDVATTFTSSNTMRDIGYSAGYIRTNTGIVQFDAGTTIDTFMHDLDAVGVNAEFGDISNYSVTAGILEAEMSGSYTVTNWGLYISGDNIIDAKCSRSAFGDWQDGMFYDEVHSVECEIGIGHDSHAAEAVTVNSSDTIGSLITKLNNKGVSASYNTTTGQLTIGSANDTGFVKSVDKNKILDVLGLSAEIMKPGPFSYNGSSFVAANGMNTTLGELGVTETQYMTMNISGTVTIFTFGTNATLQSIANEINLRSAGFANINTMQGDDQTLATVHFNNFINNINRIDTSTMTALSTLDPTAICSSGTYKISTTEELVQLANMVNNGKLFGNVTNLKFVLANDIDLSSIDNWTPIGGVSGKQFMAFFDGNGYTISNLKINDSSREYNGLFGKANKATIQNVNLENVDINAGRSSGNNYTGALLGYANNDSGAVTVNNCTTSGNIIFNTGNTGKQNVGGVVGYCYKSTITNVISDTDITVNSGGGTIFAGGTFGDKNDPCTITNDYTLRMVTGASDSSSSYYVNSYSDISALAARGYISGISSELAIALGMTDLINLRVGKGGSYNENVVETGGTFALNATDAVTLHELGLSSNGVISFADGTSETILSNITLGLFKSVMSSHGINVTNTVDGQLRFESAEGRDVNTFMNTVEPVDLGTIGSMPLSAISLNSAISPGIYTISTAEDLQHLAISVAAGRVANNCQFILTNDIDMTGADDWTGIGTSTHAFIGTFNGNGHVIYNLSGENGLFNYTNDATIKNLGIENANINCENSDEKGILANYANLTWISNCYTTGEITADEVVGGLVGVAENNCSISYSYSTADVNGRNVVGGLFGALDTPESFHDCSSTGQVTGNCDQGPLVGDLAGYINVMLIDPSLLNLYYANEPVNNNTGGINTYGAYHPINAAAPTTHIAGSTNAITNISAELATFLGIEAQVYNYEGDTYRIYNPEAQCSTISWDTTLDDLNFDFAKYNANPVLNSVSQALTLTGYMTIGDLNDALSNYGGASISINDGVVFLNDPDNSISYDSAILDALGIDYEANLRNQKMAIFTGGGVGSNTADILGLNDDLQCTIFFSDDISNITVGEYLDKLAEAGMSSHYENGRIIFDSNGLKEIYITGGQTLYSGSKIELGQAKDTGNVGLSSNIKVTDIINNTGTYSGITAVSDTLTVACETTVTDGHNVVGTHVLGISQASIALNDIGHEFIDPESIKSYRDSYLNDFYGFVSISDVDALEENTEYTISNAEELLKFRDMNNFGGEIRGITVYLTNDIDMSGVVWDGAIDDFDNVFNGNGYVIKNLSGDCSLFGGNLGEHSRVQNLGIENAHITGSGGILASENAGIISNCYTTGEIEGYNVAGLLGGNDGIIRNCYSKATVTGDRDAAGLIQGNAGTIKNCYTTGNVTSLNGYSGRVIAMNNGSYTSIYSCGTVSGNTNGEYETVTYDIPILASSKLDFDIDQERLIKHLDIKMRDSIDSFTIETSSGTVHCFDSMITIGEFCDVLRSNGVNANYDDESGRIIIGDISLVGDEKYVAAGENFITNMTAEFAQALGWEIGDGKSYIQENGGYNMIYNTNYRPDTIARSQTGKYVDFNYNEHLSDYIIDYFATNGTYNDSEALTIKLSDDFEYIVTGDTSFERMTLDLEDKGIYLAYDEHSCRFTLSDSPQDDPNHHSYAYVTEMSDCLAELFGLEIGEGKTYDSPNTTRILDGTTTASVSTTLGDLGYLRLGIALNNNEFIDFYDSDSIWSIISTLSSYGINASLSQGKLTLDQTGDFIKNCVLVDESQNFIRDNLFGIEIGTGVSFHENIGSNIGVTSGTYEIIDEDGVSHFETITANTTLSDFANQLDSYGLQLRIRNYGVDITTTSGAYLSSEHEGENGMSNIVSTLFPSLSKTHHTQGSALGYDETITEYADPTLDTLLSKFDSPGSLSEGILAFTLNGQDKFININANDTIGTLIEKLEAKGLDASFVDNELVISAGDAVFEFDALNSTSKLCDNLNLTFGDDTGMYSRSSSAVMADQEISTLTDISVANWADMSTQLSTVGIKTGSFSVYRDGVKSVIEIGAEDTFNNLYVKLGTAFNVDDVKCEIVDGKLKIFSTTEGVKVLAGSSSDTSNILSICGLHEGDNDDTLGSRQLYKVNSSTRIMSEGAFRRGDVKSGKFTIGDATFNIDENTTIAGLISQINSSNTSGATAYWDSIDGKFVLSSRVSGASILNIESSDSDSNFTDIMGFTSNDGTRIDRSAQTLGSNAKFTINDTEYTAATNTITSDISRIQGLTINLKNVSNEAFDITVSKDAENVSESVQEFVDSYNELIENIDNEIANANTAFDNKFTLKQIRNQIRNIALSTFNNPGMYSNLTSIGITTQAASNSNISTSGLDYLYLDASKFNEKFSQSPDSIKALLVGEDSAPGILMQIENIVENALSSGTGYFASAEKSYQRKIENINDKISKANQAVEKYRARLENKFKTMDMLISTMQDQYKSFLSSYGTQA